MKEKGRQAPVYLSAWLSISRLSVWLSGWLSGCLSGCLSVCLAVWLSGCLAVWLSGCLAVRAFGCQSVFYFRCLSVGRGTATTSADFSMTALIRRSRRLRLAT